MHTSRWSMLLVIATVVAAVSAHVTVSPRQATPGGYTDLVFKVPTEKPVPTIKLRVEFPSGVTVSRLRIKPGWTAEIERDSAQAIKAVTWSGGKIGPHEYDEFAVSGRISAAPGDTLAIRAFQTYEGGEVVEWVETGNPEARRPAPRVAIVAAGAVTAGTGGFRTNWMPMASLALALVALTVAMRNAKKS